LLLGKLWTVAKPQFPFVIGCFLGHSLLPLPSSFSWVSAQGRAPTASVYGGSNRSGSVPALRGREGRPPRAPRLAGPHSGQLVYTLHCVYGVCIDGKKRVRGGAAAKQ
jgi:hypothetical protein